MNMSQNKSRLIFILGGARSGKSNYAQKLATGLSDRVLFVATAEALDDEMKARIEKHKQSRPHTWYTLEISQKIANALKSSQAGAEVTVIDCLTLLISNITGNIFDYADAEKTVLKEIKGIIDFIDSQNGTFIIVSNEVGQGIVPENRSAREYRDLLGTANQLVAQRADDVYFMIAGIPQKIKEPVNN